MKKSYFIYVAIIVLMLHSCQTVNMISIDYLVPAEISFPDQIKRVGIINNASEVPGRIGENSELDSILLKKTNGYLERYMLNGDPRIVTESLAESVAAENYFNEVIISDSALQVSGTPKQEPMLNKEVVRGLTKSLDVDLLIVLEEIQIGVQRQVYSMGDMGYLGSVDVKVYPKVNLYIPNRVAPLVMINGKDSIFWEGIENTVLNARTKVIPDEELIREASDFAGTIPVKYMTPHWKTAERFYFTNGSPEMRDAAFFLQSDDWDKAFALWERAFQTQKGKKKALIASNISLYYEMKDDLDKAEEWGIKALELMKATSKPQEDAEGKISFPTGNYARINYNLVDLSVRKNNFSKLKMQMDRFNDDF